MRSVITIAYLVGAFLLQGVGIAQTGTLEVLSSAEEAVVFVDSVEVGTVADRFFSVAPDTHRVSVSENADLWDSVSTSAITVVPSGDTSRVSLELPQRYRIETFPIGAEVTWERAVGVSEELGEAPVTLDHEGNPDGQITATLSGYRPTSIDASTLIEGRSTLITLVPENPDLSPEAVLPTARTNHARRFIDYGLIAGAVAAAVLAVHFKFQANDLDDQYRNPESEKFGDDNTLQRIERFDTYSTIALGASTAALGVLSIRFIIR